MAKLDVMCGSCDSIVQPDRPKRKWTYTIAGALFLGLFGLGIGLTIGVATAGIGITAAPFTILIGLYAGAKGGSLFAEFRDGVTCPECGHNFSERIPRRLV